MKRLNKKGFTVWELVFVIALMAVSTAVLAPKLLSYVAKSRAENYINSFCEQYDLTIVAGDTSDVCWSTEEIEYVFRDNYNQLYTITFDMYDGNPTFDDDELKAELEELKDSNHQNETEENNSDDTQTIQIPEGYKFVMWADETKTSYIVEDENGVQSIIIIREE